MQNKDNIDNNTDIYLVKRTNCKFTNNDIEDDNKHGDIYIMSKWPKCETHSNDNGIHKIEFVLQTSIDGKCLTGELSIKDMQCTATELNMSYSLLRGECRMALSADEKSDTLSLYKFVLERNSNENLFILWKQQSNVQIQYFDVKLCEKRDNVDMLDVLVSLVQKMPQTTAIPHVVASTTNYHQADDNDSKPNMNAALKECLIAQKTLESELMTKFCLLLNSKKQKINDLQDKLKELTANETTASSSKKSTANTSPMEHDDDDDDFDAETQQMILPM